MKVDGVCCLVKIVHAAHRNTVSDLDGTLEVHVVSLLDKVLVGGDLVATVGLRLNFFLIAGGPIAVVLRVVTIGVRVIKVTHVARHLGRRSHTAGLLRRLKAELDGLGSLTADSRSSVDLSLGVVFEGGAT